MSRKKERSASLPLGANNQGSRLNEMSRVVDAREEQGRVDWALISGALVAGALAFGATRVDALPILAVAMAGALALAWAAAAPLGSLLLAAFVAVLVPTEVAVKFGSLPRIGPLRIVVVLFLCGWAIRFLRGERLGGLFNELRLRRSLALFVVTAGVSAAFAIDTLTAVYAYIDHIVLGILLFMLFRRYCADENSLVALRRTLYVATAIACLFAFYERATMWNPYIDFYEGEEFSLRQGILRCRSTFFHPIAFGCFLNLLLPFVLADVYKGQAAPRVVLLALLVLMGAGMFMTVSRMPWICLCLETLVIVAFSGRMTGARALASAVMVVLAALAAIVAYDSTDLVRRLIDPLLTIGEAGQGTNSSEYYRIAVIDAVLNYLEGFRWIIGTGPGTFQIAEIPSRFAGQNHKLYAPDMHYARVLLEYGLLGLLALALLLASVLRECARAVRVARPDNRMEAAACSAAIIGFILVNATVSMFFILPLAMLFWLCVARVVTIGRHLARSS
jgi:hypothetical protein